METLKGWYFSLVDKATGRVYRGWRYAVDRRAVRRILREDYGRFQLLVLKN